MSYSTAGKLKHNISKSNIGSDQKTLAQEKPNIITLKEVHKDTQHNEMDGAIQWFMIHRGALGYPEKPSQYTQQMMIGFIMGLYLMLRCESCSEHAQIYTEERLEDGTVRSAVKSRKALFAFFVDFHNYVNKRQGKKIYTYEEAMVLYSKYWKVVYPHPS